ncbi:hypothetical protein RB595_003269 [Gaeumannomyces hyphopodioides]
MGWLDGLFGGQPSDNGSDPLQKLDPKLREFLEKESPVKFKPADAGQQQQQPQQQPPQPDSRQQQPPPAAATATATTQGEGTSPAAATAVPRESQFPDGRYAHLWRTYRPQAEVEAEAKSDHEKLMDVLEGYKERRSNIGRAALENCALEQLDWTNCMKAGDWAAKFTMCSAQVRKFERCYTMQSRLLKALGYLSAHDRPASVDEEIQMHADSLYHRMLEQEAAVAKAKEEGRPAPEFAPLITRTTFAAAADMDEDKIKGLVSEEARQKFEDRVRDLPEQERAAEEAAAKAELRAQAEAASRLHELRREKEREKELRKLQGKETILDKVSGVFKGSGGGSS